MKATLSDGRLLAAASFVREGAFLADIGTDHAYLPLHLLQAGRITHAIAADIGEGPLSRARAHIAEAGMSEQIETVLTNGLQGLEDRALTDIAICGMGGELIVDILSRAAFVRDGSIRLILQPMTRAATLRRYLAKEGFAILAERPCRAAGRVYSCLCACYDGVTRTLSPVEAELGCPTCESEEERACFAEMLERKADALRERIAARATAAITSEEDEALLASLTELQQRYR
jgi:tRNA (adenine22-N1)-methyltransferase